VLTGLQRRARRGLASVIVVASGLALPLAAAYPARADQVRSAQQWVLNALHVPSAWSLSQGRGVLVAVIDSGVNPDVSDLVGSVTSGPDLTGVGTPVTNPGWGVHGTWMASLIAGHGHGRGGFDGIKGVAPQARILSIRVITDRSDPGYSRYQNEPPSRGQQQLATAIRYAVTHGAGVISMSLGYNVASLVVRAALQFALTHNVVVVASAGNSGTAQTAEGVGQAPYSFPANYLGVLGVAAINKSGLPAYFSSENLSVEVTAPGVNVPAQGRDGKYWLVSGTSPACALTAGVAALIRSKYPKLTAAQIRRAITSSTVRRPPGGYNDQVGFGTVDAMAALLAAGRLAKQAPGGNSPAAKAHAAGYFGGGAAAVPPVPVAPRDPGRLLVLSALAAACLLAVIVSIWWSTAARPGSPAVAGAGAAGAGPGGAGPGGAGPGGAGPGGAGPGGGSPSGSGPGRAVPSWGAAGWPDPTRFTSTVADPRFPQPGPATQAPPPGNYPGQGYPMPGYQDMPRPGQPQPGQPQPGQPQPGQQYPWPGYPSYSGQPQPAEPQYRAQPYPFQQPTSPPIQVPVQSPTSPPTQVPVQLPTPPPAQLPAQPPTPPPAQLPAQPPTQVQAQQPETPDRGDPEGETT
jgi:hypothetical protein